MPLSAIKFFSSGTTIWMLLFLTRLSIWWWRRVQATIGKSLCSMRGESMMCHSDNVNYRKNIWKADLSLFLCLFVSEVWRVSSWEYWFFKKSSTLRVPLLWKGGQSVVLFFSSKLICRHTFFGSMTVAFLLLFRLFFLVWFFFPFFQSGIFPFFESDDQRRTHKPEMISDRIF